MADTLRYPIGEFTEPAAVEATDIANWIDNIEQLPVDLREVVEPLSDWQLDTPYREGGWTVRQVVHHIGDSHLKQLRPLQVDVDRRSSSHQGLP